MSAVLPGENHPPGNVATAGVSSDGTQYGVAFCSLIGSHEKTTQGKANRHTVVTLKHPKNLESYEQHKMAKMDVINELQQSQQKKRPTNRCLTVSSSLPSS